MENNLLQQEQLDPQEQLNLAILLSAGQVQPELFNINTYYTQTITAYGNGFFDLVAINQKDTIYDVNSFNSFIEDIKTNINKIYDYDFSTDNPQKNNDFLIKTTQVISKYEHILKLAGDEQKVIALIQLKNNLLEELGIYEVFVEKCNATNVTNIENRALEYAEYLSLQPQNLTTQQSQFFTTPNSSNNQISTEISYEQQDFNEFLRCFFENGKVAESFKFTEGMVEKKLPLIAELKIDYIDSIKNAETLYPKEAIIRRTTLNGTEGEVLANIYNLDTLAYNISSPGSEAGKKIEDLLNNIKQNSLQESLSYFIENAEFVFELKNTTVSIEPSSDPSFFSIPVNRTQYVNGRAIKNDKAIKFNDTFTISEQNFKLTDIIMHSGDNSNDGHYYTISKREIELTNGQKHSVFLQHDDEKTICFMKFGNEIQFIDIKDVESKLKNYNESLELSEDSSFKFATLADIKESQKIEQNFTNIIYQKEIPSSKIDNTYKGLKNYGNSCYINSFLAVVAGMNDGSEKQLLLTQLKTNGIELVNNKFSSIDEKTDIQYLVGILRINKDENRIVIYEDKSGQINTPENQKVKKKIFEEKPKTTIEPSFFSRICDFFASLDPFSSCRGN